MTYIKFSDGMAFNTAGRLRAELRSDGWYVIGMGYLIPVADKAEAEKEIAKLEKKSVKA